MSSFKPLLFFPLLLSCLFLPASRAQAEACIQWPKVYAEAAVRRSLLDKEVIISVGPIRDDTAVAGDAWLEGGLADLLLRYLQTDPKLGVLKESDAKFLPPERPARYKIGGLFQHRQGWLRAFIQLKDNKENLKAQFLLETPYPQHKEFFKGLRKNAEGILEKIGRTKIDSDALKSIQDETSNVRAFENYIKGKLALESYDPNKIEVGLVWFQESRREDTRYPLAYQGFIDAYGFLSLLHKQNDEPYNTDLEEIETMMRLMKKQAHTLGKKMDRKEKEALSENPFLEAYVHFTTGTRELAKGNASKAAPELAEAVRLVPEDALSAYYLAQAYDKLGKKDLAGRFKNQAEGINPCLKGK